LLLEASGGFWRVREASGRLLELEADWKLAGRTGSRLEAGWREAGGRLEAGWREAGGRLEAGWTGRRQAGSRLEAGWRQAGGRLEAGWRQIYV